ncbi:MAG TPA: HAMP domain-containing sensor histidine kinase [Spirochaetia bacterium]|nr:HAMP domain-containing sensor histidine kinase [Spirochaetia bacterium]
MRQIFRSFYARISTIFLLLIVVLGAGWVAIAFNSARQLFSAVEQVLNREYARSIAAEIQPMVASGFDENRVRGAIHYMMVLNPMVEIYLLNDAGKILAYFTGPSGKIERSSVDMEPVRKFVASGGERLILGDDPRGATRAKPFSAATLTMGNDTGYVYIILGGERYDATLRMIRQSYILRAGMVALLLALLSTLIVGLSLFFLLTRPLRALSDAVRAFERGESGRRVRVRGTDELAGLARSFNDMAATIEADMEKLREAERMRKELIGNISHDLRSPLASIQGYLETILLKDAQLAPEERRRFLEISLKNTASLQRLVEELFELVKLDTRQVQLKREPFQAAELAQDAVLKLKPGADAAGVVLTVEGPRDLPLVTGDIGLVERVLTNLIENAVAYTPRGGSVKVALSQENGPVQVSVIDTGTGIGPDDLSHIFDRFYRADRSRDRSRGGAGLGLAIAREIVELHGGALHVESKVNAGTRFSFTLSPSAGS